MMRRKFAALLAATLAGGTLAILAPAQPASATTVCALAAVPAAVSQGLLYPVGAPLVTVGIGGVTVTFNNELVHANWAIGGGTQLCTTGAFDAGGSLKGYCGHSTGTGMTSSGHLVSWTSVGSLLILTNGLVAVANAVPNALAGQSCAHGGAVNGTPVGPPLPAGATQFLVTGAGAATNCAGTEVLEEQLVLNLGDQTVNVLPAPLPTVLTVTFPLPNVHVLAHLCTLPTKL